jgi:hypothetical protein
MPKIDTSSWGEFPLIELFDFYLSKGDNQAQKLDEGEIPLVSSGSFNNGICKYIDKGDGISELFEGNLITIDMFGQPFYQNNPFYSVSHGRVNILNPKFHINEYIGLFIVSVLQKMYYEKYGFTTMCSQTKLKKEYIKLPITKDNKPDWQYMEDYMRNIEVRVSTSISKLESAQGVENSKIDVSSWGEFVVGKLFNIKPTKAYKLTNAELLDGGENPVVVNSAYNNGIGGASSKDTTEKGNMITFSDTVDANTIFYQENPFIGYSHVQGLYPIGQYATCWGKESLMFFAASFRKSALVKGFDYGNKFRRDIALTLKVKLPIDSKGDPDWQYMEEYMRNIEVRVSTSISKLESVLYSSEVSDLENGVSVILKGGE